MPKDHTPLRKTDFFLRSSPYHKSFSERMSLIFPTFKNEKVQFAMSLDLDFNVSAGLAKLKASRIERFRSNIQNARVRLEFQESHLDFCEREFAKWSDPEAFHVWPGVLKDGGKAIQTKDFRVEFRAKRQTSALNALEEAKNDLAKIKLWFESCSQQYTEELKYSNETFAEYRERTSKENSNG